MIDYKTYILSDEWKAKADAAKERAGQRCQLCYASADDIDLHAHHRTYKRLGHERDNDITILCAECHAKFHNVARKRGAGPSGHFVMTAAGEVKFVFDAK